MTSFHMVINYLPISVTLFSFFLSYLVTPWNRVLLEKLTGSAASHEIPRIFGTQRFTVLTSAHLPLPLYRKMHSTCDIKLANGILNLDIIQNGHKVLDTQEM